MAHTLTSAVSIVRRLPRHPEYHKRMADTALPGAANIRSLSVDKQDMGG
jgi:hypothetical protein